MLSGKPYKHYSDPILCEERVECHKLLAWYNHSAEETALEPQKSARAFNMRFILKPDSYPERKGLPHYGPTGSVGDYSIIDPPFTCDFGYHLHIGKETIIAKDCHFQDAGGIYIGDRVSIGPGVLITTMSPDTGPQAKGGSQGTYTAGMVKIEDDVFIGGTAVIMPYVTIGKGAKVGAGAVVTMVSLYI
jgi:acetyltransferase-like isoleucine patch superfamily enzyme